MLLVAVGVGYGSYHSGQKSGYDSGFRAGAEEEIASRSKAPVEEPASRLDYDPGSVIDILLNPGNGVPGEEFRAEVNSLNRAALEELARVYGLTSEETAAVLAEYDGLSEEVVTSYFEDLQALGEDRASFPADSVFKLDAYDVASDFSQVLADRSCLVFNTAMAFSSVTNREGKLMLKGLCKLVAKDLMTPVAEELKAMALVRDLDATRYELERHTRESIAELALAEDRVETTLNRVFHRTMMEGTWFEFESEANLVIEGTGSIKAGFALQDYFSVAVDHSRRVIRVTLPEPKILSSDVTYEVLNDRDGFFVSVTPEKRTRALADLRSDLERVALERGLLKKAEQQAEKVVSVLYSPISYLPDQPYRVEVGFQGRLNLIESGLD